MPGEPYEAPKIVDLGSLDDVLGKAADDGVYVTADDGTVVAFDTSVGPV